MYPMLRKNRQMNERDVKKFLFEAKVGRLGLSHNGEPYVVPVVYIYDVETDTIYIHCAKKGRKIDAIESNPKVCFEIDELSRLEVADAPCEFSQIYRSVIVLGEACLIDDPSKKAQVLNKIMGKYAEQTNKKHITVQMAERTQVIMIKILSKSGKANKGSIVPHL